MKEFYKKFCDVEMALAIICLVTSVAVIFIAAVMRAVGIRSTGEQTLRSCFSHGVPSWGRIWRFGRES